jgi:hypothetical protein
MINYPKFVELIITFLQDRTLTQCVDQSHFDPLISIYQSAKATFHSPSESYGTGAMRKERVRASSSWRGRGSRYDTVFLKLNNTQHGFRALAIARLRLFFSFHHSNISYLCALVDDFVTIGDEPDGNTGMWRVKRSINPYNRRQVSRVIPLHDIFRAAHLIPVFHGTDLISNDSVPEMTLDTARFGNFYVNKYIDHHAFEIAF